MAEFNNVEANMRKRREECQAHMRTKDEIVFSMSTFPRLGCAGALNDMLGEVMAKYQSFYSCLYLHTLLVGFTFPEFEPDPETSFTRSLFWPNEATYSGHPRFKTLTSNIRQRRGQKVILST